MNKVTHLETKTRSKINIKNPSGFKEPTRLFTDQLEDYLAIHNTFNCNNQKMSIEGVFPGVKNQSMLKLLSEHNKKPKGTVI